MTATELAAHPHVRAKKVGQEYACLCPAHPDKTPSLNFRDGDKGVVLCCRSHGCSADSIVAAWGLRLSDISHGNGHTPRTRREFIYTDEQGQPLLRVVRVEPGLDGTGKSLWQERAVAGEWVRGAKGVRRVPYRLHQMQGQTTLCIAEGEPHCDRLAALGWPSTCNLGGASEQGRKPKWRDEDTQAMVAAGVTRAVVLPDNDDPGRAHADHIARRLHAAGLQVKVVPLPELPVKGDILDWLDAGHTRDELRVLIKAAPRYVPPAAAPVTDTTRPADDEDDAKPNQSQATILVDLALGAGADLWHTPTGDPHATLTIGGHHEHHPLGSRAMREWLSRLYHTKIQRTPGSQAIADALGTLGGMARYDGAEHAVHVRIAGHDGAVYLDLGDPTWRAVEITADGWRLIAQPPVRFRRGRAVLALPAPVPGGSLDALRDVIHVSSDDDWQLLAAWEAGALRPSGPYPPLALDGEQGSGKTITARMLRRAIDPSAAELRAEPREIRDLMIAASSGWIVALDNISHLQPWLSDALCRISTGGALSTRQLYTDGDEHIVEAIRPILLTGITSVITRGDLQDRAIAITLPAIPDHHRRPEADLWAAYDRIRPAVLGALLDAVSLALRRESTIRLARLPRMADWARWVTAAEPSLGIRDGAILQAYTASRDQATEQTLDGDPLALALRALTRPWDGTAAELLTKLTTDGRVPRGWPESPRGMSGALRRLAPQLRRIGIEASTYREAGTGGRRLITIKDRGAQPSPPTPPTQPPDSFGDFCDGRGDGCDARQGQPSQPQASKSDGCDGCDDCDGCDGCAPISPQEVPVDGDGYQF